MKDFTEGTPKLNARRQTIIRPNSLDNCMEMKKIEPRGRGRVQNLSYVVPSWSVNGLSFNCSHSFREVNFHYLVSECA